MWKSGGKELSVKNSLPRNKGREKEKSIALRPGWLPAALLEFPLAVCLGF